MLKFTKDFKFASDVRVRLEGSRSDLRVRLKSCDGFGDQPEKKLPNKEKRFL